MFDAAGLSLSDFSGEPAREGDRNTRRTHTWLVRDGNIRVEAETLGERVVSFVVIEPWMSGQDIDGSNRAWVQSSDVSQSGLGSLIFVVANVVFIGVGLLLAWRNFRLGRGDRKGACSVRC